MSFLRRAGAEAARRQRLLAERLLLLWWVSRGQAREHEIWTRQGLQNILLMERYDAIEATGSGQRPPLSSSMLAGKVGQQPAKGVFGIEPLIRLALRDGSEALVAEPSTA